MVAEVGAEKVTRDGLAERVNLGKGTVLRRFRTRAGIFDALLNEEERAFQEQVLGGPPPLGPGAAPVERLIAYGRVRIAFLLEHHKITRAALDGAQPVPARGASWTTDPPWRQTRATGAPTRRAKYGQGVISPLDSECRTARLLGGRLLGVHLLAVGREVFRGEGGPGLIVDIAAQRAAAGAGSSAGTGLRLPLLRPAQPGRGCQAGRVGRRGFASIADRVHARLRTTFIQYRC